MSDLLNASITRLIEAVEHATGLHLHTDQQLRRALTEPANLAEMLVDLTGGRRVVVTGTVERRLILIENSGGQWTAADLSGHPHTSRAWPSWTQGNLLFDAPGTWLSTTRITSAGLLRLLRPRVLLAALYHPEYFPLPRFPLAISDLARAARITLLGHVELMDMQLGATLDDIHSRIASTRPDIVGVSATFGQHDLMVELLDALFDAPDGPLVVAGGSLTARNERLLLERYPRLLVARGAGEPTVQDVLAYWHGDLDRERIRGIGYQGAPRGHGTLAINRPRRTATVLNRLQTDIWPELDLLDATFQRKGVAQLESSRGCTNFCSFCPRGHKGSWAGTRPDSFGWLLDAMSEVFERFPGISRTLYLVDEEFIGRGDDAEARALAMADALHGAGFRWETSCRIDQVVRLDRERGWHIERGRMWRDLLSRGLRRCLFGVESGVTSILERFNKETTAEQNALAIRTLSALGVPTRFTYITFDHLMSEDELRATYAFQGRTDLLLRPLPELTVAEIVDGVHDEGFIQAHAIGQPFYTGISYMLVSMECLIGAAYTRKAAAAGLTRQEHPAMGRVDATFADWRIGVLSGWAQLWVDRNFALDYTLKSLEKILDGRSRRRVRDARVVIKRAAHQLLGAMIAALGETNPRSPSPDALSKQCEAIAEKQLRLLRPALASTIVHVFGALPDDRAHLLRQEHRQWAAHSAWQLINASDPCGT